MNDAHEDVIENEGLTFGVHTPKVAVAVGHLGHHPYINVVRLERGNRVMVKIIPNHSPGKHLAR